LDRRTCPCGSLQLCSTVLPSRASFAAPGALSCKVSCGHGSVVVRAVLTAPLAARRREVLRRPGTRWWTPAVLPFPTEGEVVLRIAGRIRVVAGDNRAGRADEGVVAARLDLGVLTAAEIVRAGKRSSTWCYQAAGRRTACCCRRRDGDAPEGAADGAASWKPLRTEPAGACGTSTVARPDRLRPGA